MGKLSLYGFFAGLASGAAFASSGIAYFSGKYRSVLMPIESSAFFEAAFALLGLCVALFFFDVVVIPRILGQRKQTIMYAPVEGQKIGVGMTAYNDELSIYGAVKDFKTVPNLSDLVVVDNNCVDQTIPLARTAGARIAKEPRQGYGFACMRALREAKGNIILLTEGDQTFKACDAKKFLAYIENADLVVGTRTTQELLDQNSQLDWFLNWGNQFIAKMIQLRFWGKVRLSDVGCTYRAIRREALERIIDKLEVGGSAFSPHMIMVALENDLKVVEIPITFRERVGVSKAIGRDKLKGTKLGLEMLWMILFHDPKKGVVSSTRKKQ